MFPDYILTSIQLSVSRNLSKSLSPLRSRYSSVEVRKQELLNARKEVRVVGCGVWSVGDFLTQDKTQYNAMERDLAVVNLYFGSSTIYGQSSVVQRLVEGVHLK